MFGATCAEKELRHYLNGAYFNLANKTIEITDGMWCVVIHGAILGEPDSDTPVAYSYRMMY